MAAIAEIRRYGETAMLAFCDSRDVPGLYVAAVESKPACVTEVVPGGSTILVSTRASGEIANVTQWLKSLKPKPVVDSERHVTLDVDYNGADLDIIAQTTGLSRDDVIERHCSGQYTVAFCGFAPGFAYLTGLDRSLHVPRRATPRNIVPAGSVAIAAKYSAVYPRQSPGGWHLLGTCNRTLFDVDENPPALLIPGTTVSFSPMS